MKVFSSLLVAAALLATPALLSTAWAQSGVIDLPGGETGARSVIGDRAGSAAGFGRTVSVSGDVGGDVLSAARTVDVTGAVGGDLRAMAERVTIAGSVGGSASIAAQRVDITGSVGRDMRLAAESVTLGAQSRIGDDARIAAREISANGSVEGDLTLAAESVRINGPISGDVDVRARRITLGPAAAIGGRMNWRAAEPPVIDPAARIVGGASGSVADYSRGHWGYDVPPEARRFFGAAARVAFAIAWALMTFTIGFVIAAAAPGFFDRATGALRTRTLAALGWGILLLFAPFVLALVLFATLIGIPLSVFVLVCYPIYLAGGYALGAAAFGALAFSAPTLGARAGAVALGVVAIGVLAFAPWLGAAIGFVVTAIGLGLYAVGRRA